MKELPNAVNLENETKNKPKKQKKHGWEGHRLKSRDLTITFFTK